MHHGQAECCFLAVTIPGLTSGCHRRRIVGPAPVILATRDILWLPSDVGMDNAEAAAPGTILGPCWLSIA